MTSANTEIKSSALVHGKHIMDTIHRLKCINQMLESSQTFLRAARELLEWCSDPRAFCSTFEPHLMSCLTMMRQVAEDASFDMDIAYRVITICSSHSDDFSSTNTGLLAQWSEELGKLLLLKLKTQDHSSNTESFYGKRFLDVATEQPRNSSQSVVQPGMQQSALQKQYSGDVGNLGWQTSGPVSAVDGGGNSGQPGISVVTTVWEMNPGTQMPSSQHTAGYPDSMYSRGAPMRAQAPAYQQQQPQQPGFCRQNSVPSAPGSAPVGPHYRPPYNPPSNGNPEYQPPAGALSAAAMVAAAATATATATATASMMVHDPQHQQYHHQHQHAGPSPHPSQMPPQYNMPYGGGAPRMGSPVSHMTGGPIPAQPAMAYRRSSPYASARQVMLHRKQQQYVAAASGPGGMTPAMNHPYNVGGPMTPQHSPHYPIQSQFVPGSGRVMSGMVPRGQGGVRAPPPYGSGHQYVGPAAGPMVRAVPSQAPHYQMIPSNNMQDIKPVAASAGGELQLTFPVRDGVILPPFKLQHNLPVSHHMFHLKDHIFQTLMEKPDLELQLKCYHHDDRSRSPNWPGSVSVSVNNRPLLIERGEQHRSYHKPLYLKNVCIPGNNTITINVCACCCSHLFFLQVVHRPTVRSVLQALLKKNLLPSEHCVNKIKRNFVSINGSGVDTDGVEQTSVKISMKCPITFRRVVLPARGSDCCHIQCFDLESYLQMNSERGLWRCPVCSKNAPLEGLEIDQYMWGIADQLSKSEADEINIEANASWKPNRPVIKKDEDSKAELCAGNNSSWIKVYSPASTNMPSAGSFEGHHNPMSPYPTPPNSHNSQGGGSIAHYNTGVYDVGFNSPPDFTGGPMSNRSDISENDKRMAILQRQQSGISSPQGNTIVNGSNPYSMNGGPGSNNPASLQQSGPSSVTSARPPSVVPSQGPPSNAPPSHGGPPSNAPASNQSTSHNNSNNATTAELSADLTDLVNSGSNDNPLDVLDDQDLLAYLGPQDSSEARDDSSTNNHNTGTFDDDILALLADT